jgi:putative tricarboxylic transport membrane protein
MSRDFYGGIGLLLLAVIALLASKDLPGIRGAAFGPGTAPRLFAIPLALLSLAVVIRSLVTRGPEATPYKVRGLVCVIGSILVFAASIRPLGLVIATFATTVTCAAAADDVKWRETIVWAVILTAFCSILFPYALHLPFELWPRI